MENNPQMQSINNSPETALKSRSNTIFYLTAGFLTVLLLLVLNFVNILPLSKNYPDLFDWLPHRSVAQKKPVSISGLDIAKRIVGYLDTTRTNEGIFTLTYKCNKEDNMEDKRGSCKGIFVPGWAHAGQVILAYYDLYKKTHDQSYKDKADTALDVFLKKCEKENPINCEFNFFAIYEYYHDTYDEKYKNAMLKVAPGMLNKKLIGDHLNANEGIKMSWLYDMTKDSKYKDLLIEYTDAIIAGELANDPTNSILYTNGDYPVRGKNLKALMFDFVPAYNLTKDSKYLDAAKEIIQKADMQHHIAETTAKGNSTFILYLWALLDIADVDSTVATEYRAQAKLLAQELIYRFADFPEQPRFNGDNGFLMWVNPATNTKGTLDNGTLARLFLRMDKETFNLVQ